MAANTKKTNTTSILSSSANIATIIVAIAIVALVIQRFRPQSFTSTGIAVGQRVVLPGGPIKSDKPTLVLALSTICHFCNESTSFYQVIASTVAANPSVNLIAVFPQSREEADLYLKNHKIAVHDIRQVKSSDIKIPGVPTLFLVDAAGVTRFVWKGKLDSSREAELLSKIIQP